MSASSITGAPTSTGGVATAKGFRAAGISAGIKATGKPDIALVVSDQPATAAAAFTQNKVQAAPILVCKEHLQKSGGLVRAIVVNSGCANACTGEVGVADARAMADATAALVGCPADQVLVGSTGVIGVNLPMEKLKAGIPEAFAALSAAQGPQAAQAIMTTDPFPKESCTTITIGGKSLSIRRMSGSATRSGANRSRLDSSRWNSQPTCA